MQNYFPKTHSFFFVTSFYATEDGVHTADGTVCTAPKHCCKSKVSGENKAHLDTLSSVTTCFKKIYIYIYSRICFVFFLFCLFSSLNHAFRLRIML